MKRSSFLVGLAAVLTVSATAKADLMIVGTFSGSQEVPPNFITPATGSFMGDLQQTGPTAMLTFTLTYSGLIGGDVLGANFHNGPAGSNGPDVRDYDPGLFTSPDGSFTGTWTSSDAQPLTPALVSDLLTGNIYFDIQTQQFPTGEIRAQLSSVPVSSVPEPGTIWLALLGAAGFALRGLKSRMGSWVQWDRRSFASGKIG